VCIICFHWKIYKYLSIPNCTRIIMWLLANKVLEHRLHIKIDLLGGVVEAIFVNFFGNIFAKLPIMLNNLRTIFRTLRIGKVRVIFRGIRKCSDDISNSSERFGCCSELLGKKPNYLQLPRKTWRTSTFLRNTSGDRRSRFKSVFVLVSNFALVLHLYCSILGYCF